MKQSKLLRATLLATSSALALIAAIDHPAEAASCTLVTNPSLPYSQAGNTCVVFTANPVTSGDVTNAGTVTASGTIGNHTATGIGVYIGVTLNGSITNLGTITGSANAGIFMDQSSISGSITNATGATISAHTGILIQGAGGGGSAASVGGSVINNGTIDSTGGGIGVGLASVGGGITNAGTISSGLPALVVSESTIVGSVVNSNILNVNNGTAGLLVSNGGSIGGSVINSGTISNTRAAGVAIKIFPSTPGINQTIAGSVINDTNGTLTAAKGIVIVGFYNNALAMIEHDVANRGTITVGLTGIEVLSATIGGSVTNSGQITAGQNGIQLLNYTAGNAGAPTVAGGIANSGTITSTGIGFAGIDLVGARVTGGVTNSEGGSIVATNGVGILISNTGIEVNSSGVASTYTPGQSSVTGGVNNLGTITAMTGIMVTGGSTVDSINNSGTITGSTNAINLTGEGAATTINVNGGAITGNIIGGALDTLNFTLGTGTFTYNSNFSGIGQVNVNSGAVILNGADSATAMAVNGGTLAGTGNLITNVTVKNGGTFAPGTPGTPGTAMTITGNLAFQSGAIYLVQVNPSAATMANVTGSATLGGNALAAFASGSYVTRQYDILHSGGLGGTTFASLGTTNLPANFAASLSYTSTDVFLDLTSTIGALPGSGLNGNQQNVANAINNFFNSGGTLTPNFLTIFGLSGGNLANALTQLSGEAATDGEKGAFEMMTSFLGLMLDPFVDGRGASTGNAAAFAPEQHTSLPPDIALAYASVLKAPPQQTFDQRWTSWGSGFGGYNKTDGNAAVGSNTVSARDYGFAAGMDYHFTPDTVAGFAVAGGGTNWGLVQGLGGGHSNAFQAGVYGKTYLGPAYLGVALAFTNNWFTTNRTALGDQLTANFQGQSFGMRIESGYRYALTPAAGVTPYVAIQAQSFHTPTYSETDLTGGGFGLSYTAMTATDTRSELGTRFDDLTMLNGMPLVLRARLAWAHDWVSNPALDAVFQSLPGASFVVNGAAPPENSALASASAELHMTANWSVAAKLDGEFASGSQTYAGTGTLRYTW